MASAESIWKKCCIKLKKKLHEDIYSRWIAVISAGRIESDTMVLYVSNDIYQSWLEENYLPVIQETVAEVSGEAFNIIFEVNQNAELPLPVEVAPDVQSKSAPTRRAASSSSNGVAALGGVLNPKYSFKTFVIGPRTILPMLRRWRWRRRLAKPIILFSFMAASVSARHI